VTQNAFYSLFTKSAGRRTDHLRTICEFRQLECAELCICYKSCKCFSLLLSSALMQWPAVPVP